MSAYDYARPLISQESMSLYVATDRYTASRYGKTVKAADISNVEYKIRYSKLKSENNMKSPPSCSHIFPGFLVVRNLGENCQY